VPSVIKTEATILRLASRCPTLSIQRVKRVINVVDGRGSKRAVKYLKSALN
jgi:hypothetical protein